MMIPMHEILNLKWPMFYCVNPKRLIRGHFSSREQGVRVDFCALGPSGSFSMGVEFGRDV